MQPSFNFLNVNGQEEPDVWFMNFTNIQGGPISQCLILIAILKRQMIISPDEGLSMKTAIMTDTKKARQAVNTFLET